MKLKIDTTEKTIQIEEVVDLDELMKEYGGQGFKIIPNNNQIYPIYPVYPGSPFVPSIPEYPYYYFPTTCKKE